VIATVSAAGRAPAVRATVPTKIAPNASRNPAKPPRLRPWLPASMLPRRPKPLQPRKKTSSRQPPRLWTA
jgi:hypothetical protein